MACVSVRSLPTGVSNPRPVITTRDGITSPSNLALHRNDLHPTARYLCNAQFLTCLVPGGFQRISSDGQRRSRQSPFNEEPVAYQISPGVQGDSNSFLGATYIGEATFPEQAEILLGSEPLHGHRFILA